MPFRTFFTLFFAPLVVSTLLVARPAVAAPELLVSIPPQAELVRRLLGPDAAVEVMLPAGVNHETYEPTIGKLRAFSGAKLFFKVGHPSFHFESSWLATVLKDTPNVAVVDCFRFTEESAKTDPHYWVSPRRMLKLAGGMAEALRSTYPERAEEIREREASLVEDIRRLDAELASTLAPYRGSSFLVFHPAWSVFAADYNLIELALEVEGKEPGVVGTKRVLESAKSARVTTIFVEPSSPRSSAEYLRSELGAHIEVLDPLEPKWEENLRRFAALLVEDFKRRAPQ